MFNKQGKACPTMGMVNNMSVLRTPYSVLRTPYSVLRTPYSVLRTPYSVLRTPYFKCVALPADAVGGLQWW
jgi:hypothetical protein